MVPYHGPLFNKNPDPRYLEAKKNELDLFGEDLFGVTSSAKSASLVARASEYLGIDSSDDICNLALKIDEDIAIMNRGKLEAICFCFPSSWIPRERLGQNLAQIHAPVADGRALVQASSNLTERMASFQQGSFKRYVWTISASGELSQHPKKTKPIRPRSIEDLFFRLETQITAPLADQESSLFLVKVETVSLQELWSDATKRDFIKNGVNTMSDAILLYKNLKEIKRIINS